DEWALRSHSRAAKAADEGKLQDEIVPVSWIGRKGKTNIVDKDEAIRRDTSLDQLAQLSPIYTSDGSVTAGNAPGVNDGAGAFVLMSEDKAAALGKRPLATILGFSTMGMQAHELAAAPGFAINKLLKKTGLTVRDIDLFEVNEAFASVVLTCKKIVGFDLEKVNVNGG
ncbi:acetyl-CoA C-acyltransferase, partial [Bacillus inaquosorum]|nr:acetyl-CoA C-acyltransferase [Bacillus inaquosorum]